MCRPRVTLDNSQSVYTVYQHKRRLKLQTDRDKFPTENISSPSVGVPNLTIRILNITP